MDQSALNTALITIIGTLVGIVSFVMRSLLNNIQAQLGSLTTLLNSTMGTREQSMREVQTMIDRSKETTDNRIEKLTKAVELSARADLLRLIGSPSVPSEVKDQAKAIVNEIANGNR
jgi:hypothetical protein